MSSISVVPRSGPGLAESAKSVSDVSQAASANETAKSASTTVDTVAPKYPSPTIAIDPLLNAVIIEYRDQGTGDVTFQTPSKAQLRLYTAGQTAQTAVPHKASTDSEPTTV